MSKNPAVRYLDVTPVLDEVTRRGLEFPSGSALQRQLHRFRGEGRITVAAADYWAVVVLGMHPTELWPDWCDVRDVKAYT